MNPTPHILAEIRTPIADAQITEWHWPTPMETEARETRHMLEMSLPPHATEGLGCFPEIAPQPYTNIGGMFLRPAGILLRARGPGGYNRVVRCAVTPDSFTALSAHDAEWSERELRACLDLRSETQRLLLRRLHDELAAPGMASTALVEAYATALIIETARRLHGLREMPVGGRLSPWQYRRICERVNDDAPPPTVSELAGLCGLSPRHLLRLYRNFSGETVTAYIERAQAERARRMLTETSLPLKEIAAQLGFARPSSFATAFRRACGLTPRLYRQQYGVCSPLNRRNIG